MKKVGEGKTVRCKREREKVGGGIQSFKEKERGQQVSPEELTKSSENCSYYLFLFPSAVVFIFSPCWDKMSIGCSWSFLMETHTRDARSLGILTEPYLMAHLSSHSCTVASIPPLCPSDKVAIKIKPVDISGKSR